MRVDLSDNTPRFGTIKIAVYLYMSTSGGFSVLKSHSNLLLIRRKRKIKDKY